MIKSIGKCNLTFLRLILDNILLTISYSGDEI